MVFAIQVIFLTFRQFNAQPYNRYPWICFIFYKDKILNSFFLIWLISAQILLYTDGNLNYYKVLVADGTRLVDGATVSTCEAAGMNAVCPGSSNCGYNSASCLVTAITSSKDGCTYMDTLSNVICNTTAPKCRDFEGVAVFMNGWSSGDYLVLNNGYQYGKNYVAGDGVEDYFAYCAVCNSCQGKGKCQKHPYQGAASILLCFIIKYTSP